MDASRQVQVEGGLNSSGICRVVFLVGVYCFVVIGLIKAQEEKPLDIYSRLVRLEQADQKASMENRQRVNEINELHHILSETAREFEGTTSRLGERLDSLRVLIERDGSDLRAELRGEIDNIRRDMQMLETRARLLRRSRYVTSSPREGVLVDYTEGSVRLENIENAEVASIGVDGDAGSLTLGDSNGFKVVRMSSNSAGGFLKLQTRYGKDLVYLGGGASSEKGGFAEFRSTSPRHLTRIAYIGTSESSDGVMELYAQDGKKIMTIGAKKGSKAGRAVFWGRPPESGTTGEAEAIIEIDAEASGEGAIRVLGRPYGDLLGDYAEVFEFAGERCAMLPGAVMSVTESDSRIAPSSEAYDPHVVGVLSGAGRLKPGMVIGIRKDGTNELPVAVAGQVNVRVSLEGGKIQIGDLLVASSSPGIAMRGSDPDRLSGTVIGKALEPYEEVGEGLIRMLVMVR